DRPHGSSAAPTRYQTMWLTTGTARLVTTTTCMPLSRVKVSGSKTLAPAPPTESRTRSAAAEAARAACRKRFKAGGSFRSAVASVQRWWRPRRKSNVRSALPDDISEDVEQALQRRAAAPLDDRHLALVHRRADGGVGLQAPCLGLRIDDVARRFRLAPE